MSLTGMAVRPRPCVSMLPWLQLRVCANDSLSIAPSRSPDPHTQIPTTLFYFSVPQAQKYILASTMYQIMSQSELFIFSLLKGKLDEIWGPAPEFQIGLKLEASTERQVLSQALNKNHYLHLTGEKIGT